MNGTAISLATQIDALEAARNRSRHHAEIAGIATLLSAVLLPMAAGFCLLFASPRLSPWAYGALIASPVLALTFGIAAVIFGRRERRANAALGRVCDNLDFRAIEHAPFAACLEIGDHEIRTDGATVAEAALRRGRPLCIVYQCAQVLGGTLALAWTALSIWTRDWDAGYEYAILGDVRSSIAYLFWIFCGVGLIVIGFLPRALHWTLTSDALTCRRTKWIFGQTERTYPRHSVKGFEVRARCFFLQLTDGNDVELLELGAVTPRRGLIGSAKYQALAARHRAIVTWQAHRLIRTLSDIMQLHPPAPAPEDE